ncbi:MAG: peptidyl-prolyl cis-trans isomerase A (cyclophilin A) [Bradymonadia bacterium]|jgi:peptidyl-prolyl cis-trans isomerase A (cyclophilin A)
MSKPLFVTLLCASCALFACKSGEDAEASTGGDEAAAEASGDEAAGEEQDGTETAQADGEEADPAAEVTPPTAVDQAEIAPLGTETAEQILGAIEGDGTLYAVITTTMGAFNCELYEELAPNTVANFVGLATGTKTYIDPESQEPARSNFYDGLIFHRVIPSFMIQGGDPEGTGRGGPGYAFPDEFHPQLRHDRGALLSMANSGPNTNGSQFFVTEVATPHLDNRHTVFGACEEMDLVNTIARVPTGPGNRPLEDVTIETLVIERR